MKQKNQSNFSEEASDWPDHGLIKLSEPFIDTRGKIQPLVDSLMQSAVMIESKAGSLRANHYHKTDWHYSYVLSGVIEYYFRPANDRRKPKKLIVNIGEMIFTPPMMEHSMVFPVDTVFLALSRNPRDQDSYEADLVRVDLISTNKLTHWKPASK